MRFTSGEQIHHQHVSTILVGRGFENTKFLRYLRRRLPTAKDFHCSVASTFEEASRAVPGITSRPGVLGGSPCVRGTRIPVYMILDAIDHYGTVDGALKSYPKLTKEQVRDAIRFAKSVMERPVDNKAEGAD
jgi:uncharacterized protein (DUF433 family)